MCSKKKDMVGVGKGAIFGLLLGLSPFAFLFGGSAVLLCVIGVAAMIWLAPYIFAAALPIIFIVAVAMILKNNFF